jgi:hypothetical protein
MQGREGKMGALTTRSDILAKCDWRDSKTGYILVLSTAAKWGLVLMKDESLLSGPPNPNFLRAVCIALRDFISAPLVTSTGIKNRPSLGLGGLQSG